MKFIEAMEQVKTLVGKYDQVSFKTDVCLSRFREETTIEVGVVFIPFSEDCHTRAVSFYAENWQGVIDKLKIHLLPKGVSSLEEIPEETTNGKDEK